MGIITYLLGRGHAKTKKDLSNEKQITKEQKRIIGAMSRSVERTYELNEFKDRLNDATTADELNSLYAEIFETEDGK